MEDHIYNFLDNNREIDGLISIDNVSGVVALNQAKKLGISIPRDLSIIAFSDENVIPFSEPKLSTLSQHTMDIGKSSFALLIDSLKNKGRGQHQTKIIKPHLILRETTL